MTEFSLSQIIDAKGQGIVTLKLAGKYLSAQLFGTHDRTPDIDGVIHLRYRVDEDLHRILHFQLKSTQNLKNNHFYCRRDILDYLSSANTPTLLLVADVSRERLYWYYLSGEERELLNLDSDKRGRKLDLTDKEIPDNLAEITEKWFEIAGRSRPPQLPPLATSADAQVVMQPASSLVGKREANLIIKKVEENINNKNVSDLIEELSLLNKSTASERQKYAYHIHVGNVYMTHGFLSKAQASYVKAMRYRGSDMVAINNRALAYALDDNDDRALKLLKRYKGDNPKNASYWVCLGIAHVGKAKNSRRSKYHLRQAKEAYEKARKLDSKDDNIAFNYLRCLELINDEDQLRKWEQVCEEKYLSNPLIRNHLAIKRFKLFRETLQNKFLKEMGDLIRPAFEEIATFDADDNVVMKMPFGEYTAQTYRPILDNMAVYLYHSHKTQKAENIWKALLLDSDQYESAHQNMGMIRLSEGNFEEAVEHLEKAKSNPEFRYQTLAGALMESVRARREIGGYILIHRIKEAARYFKKAYEKEKLLYLKVNEAACRLYYDVESAKRILSRVLEIDPNHYLARLNWDSIQYDKSRNWKVFRRKMESLTEKHPDEYVHLFVLASHFKKRGEYDVAEETYDSAMLKLMSNNHRIEDMMAQGLILEFTDFLEKIGNLKKAMKILNQCVKNLSFTDRLQAKLSEMTFHSHGL